MHGSRNLHQGVPGQSDKKSSDNVFFFFSPQLILKKSNGQFKRNLSFFKVPEGVKHFPGGGGGSNQGSNFFQGGSNCWFLLETHIACDFPGGSGPPVPPSGSTLARPLLMMEIKEPSHWDSSFGNIFKIFNNWDSYLEAYMFIGVTIWKIFNV